MRDPDRRQFSTGLLALLGAGLVGCPSEPADSDTDTAGREPLFDVEALQSALTAGFAGSPWAADVDGLAGTVQDVLAGGAGAAPETAAALADLTDRMLRPAIEAGAVFRAAAEAGNVRTEETARALYTALVPTVEAVRDLRERLPGIRGEVGDLQLAGEDRSAFIEAATTRLGEARRYVRGQEASSSVEAQAMLAAVQDAAAGALSPGQEAMDRLEARLDTIDDLLARTIEVPDIQPFPRMPPPPDGVDAACIFAGSIPLIGSPSSTTSAVLDLITLFGVNPATFVAGWVEGCDTASIIGSLLVALLGMFGDFMFLFVIIAAAGAISGLLLPTLLFAIALPFLLLLLVVRTACNLAAFAEQLGECL